MAKEEKKPEIRINRDGAQNILILTNSPIMSMSSNYDLDQAEVTIFSLKKNNNNGSAKKISFRVPLIFSGGKPVVLNLCEIAAIRKGTPTVFLWYCICAAKVCR